jgi:hypothetical protein
MVSSFSLVRGGSNRLAIGFSRSIFQITFLLDPVVANASQICLCYPLRARVCTKIEMSLVMILEEGWDTYGHILDYYGLSARHILWVDRPPFRDPTSLYEKSRADTMIVIKLDCRCGLVICI